jgi:hypothetical protein
MMKAMQTPEGDFRDWPASESWAANIARDLERVPGQRAPKEGF